MAEATTNRVTTTLGLLNTDVTALRTSLGISTADMESFLLSLTDVEWGYAPAIQEAVKYLGFDAKKIIAQFFTKASQEPANTAQQPTLVVGNAKLYERCHAPTDLMFLITLFLERGNNISKALLRCEPTVADVVRRKCNAYGIQIERRQNASILGTSHLTLARIAQAFAPATVSIIISHGIQGKLTSKLFTSPLPLVMQHTIFAGLIPQGQIYSENLRYIACILNAEMSILLATPKDKRKMLHRSFEDLMEEAQMFVDAAINGSALSDAIKIKALVKAGILTLVTQNDGTTTVEASTVLQAMAGQIPAIRSASSRPYMSMLPLK